MNINFREDTYQGMLHCANESNMSMAAFISALCDKFVEEHVITTHRIRPGSENVAIQKPFYDNQEGEI